MSAPSLARLGRAIVLQGDARRLPLPDASVDLIVTSPPYWALRSYRDGGQHYDGQIGAEPTPGEYIENLIACTRDLILRAELVWQKRNSLPESVTDRVRRSHETWFHLTKQPRYFAAVDEIRQPHQAPGVGKGRRHAGPAFGAGAKVRAADGSRHLAGNPLGALPGSVWEIALAPLKVPAELGVDHFAAFPPEWPRRLILGWSPPEICIACGEGRRPPVEKPGLLGGDNNPDSRNGTRRRSTIDGGRDEWRQRIANPDRIVGYICGCASPLALTRPSVVLDPFGGTGTTAMVARALGRTGISVDLSGDYCRIARWRTGDRKQLAKVLGLPPPLEEPDNIDPLFALEDLA